MLSKILPMHHPKENAVFRYKVSLVLSFQRKNQGVGGSAPKVWFLVWFWFGLAASVFHQFFELAEQERVGFGGEEREPEEAFVQVCEGGRVPDKELLDNEPFEYLPGGNFVR